MGTRCGKAGVVSLRRRPAATRPADSTQPCTQATAGRTLMAPSPSSSAASAACSVSRKVSSSCRSAGRLHGGGAGWR